MVQLGRDYRAAIPRNNLVDRDWNRRLPFRWKIDGLFIYGGTEVDYDGMQHLDYIEFDGSTITWTWGMFETIVPIGPFGIHRKVTITPPNTWTIVDRIEIAGGDYWQSVRVSDHTIAQIILNFAWPVGITPSVTMSAPFDPSTHLAFLVVKYAEEP